MEWRLAGGHGVSWLARIVYFLARRGPQALRGALAVADNDANGNENMKQSAGSNGAGFRWCKESSKQAKNRMPSGSRGWALARLALSGVIDQSTSLQP